MAFCIILHRSVLISVSDESGRAVRSSCAVPDIALPELLCDAKALLGESGWSGTCCAARCPPMLFSLLSPRASSFLMALGARLLCPAPGKPSRRNVGHDFQTMGCSVVLQHSKVISNAASSSPGCEQEK